MLKTVFASLIVLAFAGSAMAADRVIRDASGNRTGTIERDKLTGRTVTKDAAGRRTGTIDYDKSIGKHVIRDASGKRIGTLGCVPGERCR